MYKSTKRIKRMSPATFTNLGPLRLRDRDNNKKKGSAKWKRINAS